MNNVKTALRTWMKIILLLRFASTAQDDLALDSQVEWQEKCNALPQLVSLFELNELLTTIMLIHA
jgi:hypothetical protein